MVRPRRLLSGARFATRGALLASHTHRCFPAHRAPPRASLGVLSRRPARSHHLLVAPRSLPAPRALPATACGVLCGAHKGFAAPASARGGVRIRGATRSGTRMARHCPPAVAPSVQQARTLLAGPAALLHGAPCATCCHLGWRRHALPDGTSFAPRARSSPAAGAAAAARAASSAHPERASAAWSACEDTTHLTASERWAPVALQV